LPPLRLALALTRSSTCETRVARVLRTRTTPERTNAPTTTSAIAIARRVRMLTTPPLGRGAGHSRSGRFGVRGAQRVAEPTHGADQLGVAVVEFATQVADVGLDGRRITDELVVPDVVEDLGPGDDAVAVEHQVAEQTELGGGERDLGVAAPDPAGILV